MSNGVKKEQRPIILIAVVIFSYCNLAFSSPNFIVVLLDDYGWTSLSTPMDKTRPEAKSDYYRTPNMDKLLAMGMRFSNGYAAAPVCSPTRYSIQFGKTPARLHRTRGLGPNHVDHEQVSIPQILRMANDKYRTAHIGKWHIDADPGIYGYDVHDGMTRNKEGGYNTGDHARQWQGYARDDPKLVDALTNRAIQFIRDSVQMERPFFLQLSHYAVHSNIVYKASSYLKLGERSKGSLHKNQGYAAMIHDLDLSIGTLLKAYKSLGLGTNTYIIFMSDNGGMPVLPQQTNRGNPYPIGLNYPLLRGKWDLTEGGIRVPFGIAGPGIQPDSQSDTPVISYDLLPTVADLADSFKFLPKDIDGGSLKPVAEMTSSSVVRSFEGLIFHYPHYNRAGMNEPHSAIRYGAYKLIRFPVSDRSLLFNVERDPGEQNDLTRKLPAISKALDEKMLNYLMSVQAERPEDAFNWESVGEGGKVRTNFFQRYANP